MQEQMVDCAANLILDVRNSLDNLWSEICLVDWRDQRLRNAQLRSQLPKNVVTEWFQIDEIHVRVPRSTDCGLTDVCFLLRAVPKRPELLRVDRNFVMFIPEYFHKGVQQHSNPLLCRWCARLYSYFTCLLRPQERANLWHSRLLVHAPGLHGLHNLLDHLQYGQRLAEGKRRYEWCWPQSFQQQLSTKLTQWLFSQAQNDRGDA